MQDAIAACRDAVCFVDLRSRLITYANPAARILLGLDEGDPPRSLADLGLECADEELRPEPDFQEFGVCHNDGRRIPVLLRLIALPQDTTGIVLLKANSTAGPISEVDRDPLTGLSNRRVFESRLDEALRQHQSCEANGFAVLFVDLDNFKAVNDTLGHSVGDRLLCAVAERLTHCLRPNDTVARYGGDEFVVLLDAILCEQAATTAAERVLHEISQPFSIDGRNLNIGASVGIVLSSTNSADVATAVEAADRAMYRAKARGTGHYEVFEEIASPLSDSRDSSPSPQEDRTS